MHGLAAGSPPLLKLSNETLSTIHIMDVFLLYADIYFWDSNKIQGLCHVLFANSKRHLGRS